MGASVACLVACLALQAQQYDPLCVVETWSDTTKYACILDVNFSDADMPDTWMATTGRDCPSYDAGGYHNGVLELPLYEGGQRSGLTYPLLFRHVTFANRNSYGGYAAATAAFARQYYVGENATQKNDWKQPGHTRYLEDEIEYDAKGRPTKGVAGYAHLCRDGGKHGWIEIDHIPYVERVQWSWSSSSWGRGMKCDYKVGDGEWKPLVWMGSNRQKNGYTVYSDQGYFMENVINASDVSLRWRIWDGDPGTTTFQTDAAGNPLFNVPINTEAQWQPVKIHKIRIYGNPVTAEQATYARENPVSDVGEVTYIPDTPDTPDTPDAPGDEAVRLKAFPTAEGFGQYATGGRGGSVVTVTNLNDSGEGSLRWAFDQHKGEPLTVVFAVSGEIVLQSELSIARNDFTLAGQTAPGLGIVISHHKVDFGGSQNFIVRNIRFRIGGHDAAGNVIAENACGAENCSNFIFDHCNFGWSVEENMNAFDSHFHTVQYSIVHEGLYDAGHAKGARGYGCQWGGSPATYHHNLLAHNNSRSCRFNGARGEDYVVYLEYINNVNYNWGGSLGCYGGENTADISEYNGLNSAHEVNFVNNYYRPGPNTTSQTFIAPSKARDGATSWCPSQWYIDGNVMHGNAGVSADNWSGIVTPEGYTKAQCRVDTLIRPVLNYYRWTLPMLYGEYDYDTYAYAATAYPTAAEAYADVLAHAGTVRRDAVEERIVADVAGGKATYGGATKGKGIIDSETDAEGFYAYPTDYEVPADTDGDGMPDDWERSHGLNPALADNNVLNADGYTALEVYLASLMGESMDTKFTSRTYALQAFPLLSWNIGSATLSLGDMAGEHVVTVFDTSGGVVYLNRTKACTLSLDSLAQGVYLVSVMQSEGGVPRMLKIIKH